MFILYQIQHEHTLYYTKPNLKIIYFLQTQPEHNSFYTNLILHYLF